MSQHDVSQHMKSDWLAVALAPRRSNGRSGVPEATLPQVPPTLFEQSVLGENTSGGDGMIFRSPPLSLAPVRRTQGKSWYSVDAF